MTSLHTVALHRHHHCRACRPPAQSQCLARAGEYRPRRAVCAHPGHSAQVRHGRHARQRAAAVVAVRGVHGGTVCRGGCRGHAARAPAGVDTGEPAAEVRCSPWRRLLALCVRQIDRASFRVRRGLVDASCAYVELGCGRGMLSLALAEVLPACDLFLIDIAGVRRKVGRCYRLCHSQRRRMTVT